MPVGCYNVLLVLDIIDNSPLHLENAIFMERPDELLSSVDFVLHIGQGSV